MTSINNKNYSLSKAALARVNNIETGVTYAIDSRVSPLSQSLGITYDADSNIVINSTNNDIDALQNDSHTHSNKATLDNTTEAFTTVQVNQIAAIATALGITFNVDGTINVDGYAAHTHSYLDNDGTTDTARTTGGVA